MKHEELSRKIIGAAMMVRNELKPGLDEKLYENALVIELAAHGHVADQQREYPVHYRGHFIGKLVPDLIVDNAIVVDRHRFCRFTYSANAGIPKNYRLGSRAPVKLQGRKTDLEASGCRQRQPTSRESSTTKFLTSVPIRAIRG